MIRSCPSASAWESNDDSWADSRVTSSGRVMLTATSSTRGVGASGLGAAFGSRAVVAGGTFVTGTGACWWQAANGLEASSKMPANRAKRVGITWVPVGRPPCRSIQSLDARGARKFPTTARWAALLLGAGHHFDEVEHLGRVAPLVVVPG